jgi:hypothetical protein
MLDEITPEVTPIEVSTRGARETNKASPKSSCHITLSAPVLAYMILSPCQRMNQLSLSNQTRGDYSICF